MNDKSLTYKEIVDIVNGPPSGKPAVSDIFAKTMAKILDEQKQRKDAKKKEKLDVPLRPLL